MTILQALKSYSKYPLRDDFLGVVLISRELDGDENFTPEIAKSSAFIGARADCYKDLIDSPNVSEGGLSISLTYKDKIVNLANDLYVSIGEPKIGESAQSSVTPIYEW